jgi:hypothetical protein
VSSEGWNPPNKCSSTVQYKGGGFGGPTVESERESIQGEPCSHEHYGTNTLGIANPIPTVGNVMFSF